MANKIQIKRSVGTAAVSGLANGELAFTQASNTLWIGLPDGTGVLSIGGARVPGTLTANQALVANSTSGIDKVIVANLVPTGVWANGTGGTAGQLLASNGSGGVYWAQQSATGVTSVDTGNGLTGGPITSTGTVSVLANSGIIANTTGLFADGANGISVDASGINVLAGNSQLVSNSTGLWVNQAQINHNALSNYAADQHVAHTGVTLTAGNGLTGGGDISASRTFAVGAGNGIQVNADDVAVLANSGIVANTTGVFVNTAYIATLSANNATYLNGQLASFYTNATNITTGTLPYAQIPANIVNTTAGFALGGLITFNANVTFSNSTAVFANGVVGTAGHVLHSNGTGVYWAADDQGVTSVSSGNGLTGGPITTTGTLSVLANNGIIANSTGIWADGANGISVDASGINVLAGNSQLVSNSTGVWINQAQINHNALSNYVADQHVAHTSVSITAGNGLTGGGDISASRTLNVNANSGIVANAFGVFVLANSGIVANTTGVFAKQANGISVDASGINVLAANGIVSNSTGVYAKAGTGVTVDTNGISIGQAVGTTSFVTFANVVTTDMTVSGNLTVSGTTTTLNTQNLLVNDNMIGLADTQNDTASFLDAVDSGFYVSTGNTLNSFYSGIARIAGSSTNTNPTFRVFATGTLPNSTVLTGLSTGTMQAFLAPYGSGGAFVVNSTAMAINANSTVSLGIAANTLSLSTALPATSGGTGYNTYAAGDLLVGNTGNSFTKLSVGADGTVLQISGTSVIWNSLDGGTF